MTKKFGSILLVAGTAIGAGMLALPISTGAIGFWYSSLLFFAAFVFMLMSLFLLLEVTLWTKKPEANLITMARQQLGLGGEVIAWVSFLLLLYAVAAAYISAGGGLLLTVVNSALSLELTPNMGMGIFVLVFGCFVVFDTKAVDRVNRLFALALILSFFLLIIFTSPFVSAQNLTLGNPDYMWGVVPVVILSFTSHIIVPSLRTYLKSNVKELKRVLILGSLIPLVFYLIWELFILGTLPMTGDYSITEVGKQDHPIAALTHALYVLIGTPVVSIIVGCFSFFALVTSFFGVSLSLFDFLADGFRVKKNFSGKMSLLFMMFIPPLLFSIFYPKGFIVALGYAGVFVAVLYGILPAVMVWRGRYIKNIKEPYKVPGGKFTPAIVFLGALLIIFLQIAATNQWLPSLF